MLSKYFFILFFFQFFIYFVLGNYDYFLFTQFWAGGQNVVVPNEIRYFTIHGLWAERYDGSYPEYCNRSIHFNMTKLDRLEEELKYKWYDYEHKNSEIFWKHEWLKHGSCSLDVLPTEINYFATALKMHNKYNLTNILRSGGIIPGNVYPLWQMEMVLISNLKSKVRLMCENGELNMVEVCLNKNLVNIDCFRESKCGKYVNYKQIRYAHF